MRSLAHDIADVVFALEELMLARARGRHDLLPFLLLIAGFERAQARLASIVHPSRPMLEELFSQSQAALGLVRAESAREPRPADLATLELSALIEAVGQRLCALPTSPNDATPREPPALLVS